MKQKLKPIAMSVCLLGVVSIPAIAAHKSQSLEQQVAELRHEIETLKGHSTAAIDPPPANRSSSKHKTCKTCQQSASVDTSSTTAATTTTSTTTKVPPTSTATNPVPGAQAQSNETEITGPQYLPTTGTDYFPMDVNVPGQSFVSTGPYIGVPLQYNGTDLIINNPSVNEDVSLLNLRKNIIKRLCALGLKPESQSSHLLLSGVVEGQAGYRDVGGGFKTSDIDVTNVGIDAYILGPSTWTSGLISLSYDNNIGAQTGSFSINARTQNSHVFVNKAFIVIGNFMRSPFYGTIGQMYVPFGQYSSTLVSSPLTKLIFRIQTRAILLGYQQQCKNALYGSIFAFHGDSHVGNASRVNNGGINIGYKYDLGKCGSGNIGAGVIGNIADSQGMQNNGFGAVYVPPSINVPASSPVFGGFGGLAGTGNEQLVHRVPGYDLRGLFSIYKTVDVIVEYITASTRFNSADMTMQAHAAKPRALNTELAYTFQGTCKPVSISAGYGMAKDALALGMPAQRYSLVLNGSYWRNTLQSLEFRHDVNYPESASSSGSGIPGPSASGRTDNSVTAQFDIYF